MKKREFTTIAKKAFAKGAGDVKGSFEVSNHLVGCGLPQFKPVMVTEGQLCNLLRYQCCMFNGQIDMEELQSLQEIAIKKFTLI
jgi:hypothetical protein